MGRHAKFSANQIYESALAIAAERGPTAVTMGAIAERTGAPIGSIYHRFDSRDHLMARLWLDIVQSFQDGFLSALETGDGLSAALYAPRWVREHFDEGRVLLLFRREELVTGRWPEEFKEQATALPKKLEDGFSAFVTKRFGRVTGETLATIAFALIHVPYGAVRPYLERGQRPPAVVDRLIEKTYRSILRGIDEDLKRT